MEVDNKKIKEKKEKSPNKKRKLEEANGDNSPAKKVKTQEGTKNEIKSETKPTPSTSNKNTTEKSESKPSPNKNSTPKSKANKKKNSKANKKPRISDGCRILICEMPLETSKKEIMAFLKSAGNYFSRLFDWFLLINFHTSF